MNITFYFTRSPTSLQLYVTSTSPGETQIAMQLNGRVRFSTTERIEKPLVRTERCQVALNMTNSNAVLR